MGLPVSTLEDVFRIGPIVAESVVAGVVAPATTASGMPPMTVDALVVFGIVPGV